MYLRLRHNGKGPAERGPWRLTDELPDGNVGLTLEDRTVLDFDNKQEGRNFYQLHSERCTVIVETRRGVHFHFAGETQARKFQHGDIKSGPHAYVVIPPSIVGGWHYRWVREGELQPFPVHLFPLEQKREVIKKQIKDARAYIAKIESIQGQSGSAGLVRAAARCRDGGLSESEATIELLAWNAGPTVSPPWKPEEIARAITRVYAKG